MFSCENEKPEEHSKVSSLGISKLVLFFSEIRGVLVVLAGEIAHGQRQRSSLQNPSYPVIPFIYEDGRKSSALEHECNKTAGAVFFFGLDCSCKQRCADKPDFVRPFPWGDVSWAAPVDAPLHPTCNYLIRELSLIKNLAPDSDLSRIYIIYTIPNCFFLV